MKRTTLTPEQRKERLDAAEKAITDAVGAIISGDEWKAYLEFTAKMPNYSARNCFWLQVQMVERGWDSPGYVASYTTWQKLDRQVRKGESSLKVLAPVHRKLTEEDGTEKKVIVGFKIESVFAQRQTEGDGVIPSPVRPELLRGKGPYGAWEGLVELIEAQGFTVSRGQLSGGVNGVTDMVGKTVVVIDSLEEAAAVKTLTHELAHVLLHQPDGSKAQDYLSNRPRLECEAESVAFMVMDALGLTTDDYSFPYVAGWSNGDTATVISAADTAKKCATRILNQLSEQLELQADRIVEVEAAVGPVEPQLSAPTAEDYKRAEHMVRLQGGGDVDALAPAARDNRIRHVQAIVESKTSVKPEVALGRV